MKQLSLLLGLYAIPLKTFSRIIDEGRFLFAFITAIAVVIVLQVPRGAESSRQSAERYNHAMQARAQAQAARAQGQPAPDEDEPSRPSGLASLQAAVERFTAHDPAHFISPLAALAICFVPLAILVVTLLDNLGGFSTILFRDYMAVLVCCLLAWSAAYLPLALINNGLLFYGLPAFDHPALWLAAHAYFLVLAVMGIRTVFGTKFAHAASAVGGAWAGSVGGLLLYSMFGGVTGYLASPFILYYLFTGLAPEFRSLGGGLRSRQRLKQHLEVSTLNPRDADAHYQLGLIYMQRRRYELAAERFRQSIAVDPNEADPYFQLGLIAREEKRYDEALEHFRTAARLNDKLASNEVWRELGATGVLAGKYEEAVQALERYLQRRSYDPEGNCWYGRALAGVGRIVEARAAFEQAIDSVRTAPPALRRKVKRWETEAAQELKKL